MSEQQFSPWPRLTIDDRQKEHVCSGNCNRFDRGDVLGVDWYPRYAMSIPEILEDQPFEDLSNEVQKFLIGTTAMSLTTDARIARTNLTQK